MKHLPKITKQFYSIIEEENSEQTEIKVNALIFTEYFISHMSLNKTESILASNINQVVNIIKQQYPKSKRPRIFRDDLKYVSISIANKRLPVLQMWL